MDRYDELARRYRALIAVKPVFGVDDNTSWLKDADQFLSFLIAYFPPDLTKPAPKSQVDFTDAAAARTVEAGDVLVQVMSDSINVRRLPYATNKMSNFDDIAHLMLMGIMGHGKPSRTASMIQDFGDTIVSKHTNAMLDRLLMVNKLIAMLPEDLVDHQLDLIEQSEPGYGA